MTPTPVHCIPATDGALSNRPHRRHGSPSRTPRRLSHFWALVVAVACLSASSTASGQTLFYADFGGAESLTSSLSYLAWSTDDCMAGDFEVCMVRMAWTNGAFPPNVYEPFDNSGGPSSPNIASNIASSRSYAYWLSQGGEVLRRHVGYPNGDPEVVAAMEMPGSPGEIAADQTHVYWLENAGGVGRLFRASVDGGPREFVTEAPDDVGHDLQVDGTGRVYFLADVSAGVCCVDPLHQITPDGAGGFTTTFSVKSHISGYTLDGSEVFVASRVNAGADLVIARGDLSSIDNGGSWTDLYNAGSTGPPEIHHLALTDDDLFWHEESALGGSPLLRMARSGGSPDPLTVSLLEARDMLIGGDSRQFYVYYRNNGSIFRTPTNAATFSRDFKADDIVLEVTQAIQNASHTVPLAEGKRTFVRAYARIKESSDGATELSIFPAVLLEGRRGGIPLEDSPLRPIDRLQPLRDGAADRTKTANQFLFELPESWTSGTITLTATVDPRDVEFESDETNNESTRSVSFDPVGGICMDIIPVRTTLGIERGGSPSDKAVTFARARSLLPTDDLVWIFRGGSPKSKPWTGDPYNFFEEDDTRELMFHWWFDFNFSGTPSQCGSRRTIRTAAVSGSSRFGLSSDAAALIYYLQQIATGPPAENFPLGGVAGLAHEVGHQLGQEHIGCPMSGDGAPGSPDGGYPYGPCTIEDLNDHLGFDVLTRKLIVPFDDAMQSQYQDYMSYQPDYWTSDYVYRNHFAELSSSTPSPPVAGGGPLLVGGFQRGDGSVELAPAYELDAARQAVSEQVLGASTDASTDFRVRIYDTNNLLQVDEPLRVVRTVEEVVGDPVYTSFFGLVETQADYKQIEIVDGGGNPLYSSSYGTNPPAVTITNPAPGSVLGDTVQVVWSSIDPDGDVLTYRLLYSPDGGGQWIDLVTTRDTFAVVDMIDLPTGPNARFEVLVSDGLHSASDSVGPFALTNRPPTATILLGDYSEPVEPVAFSFDEPAVLHGLGSDSDDGPLTGASLEWVVTGPANLALSDDTLSLRGLPPGDYEVSLVAKDSDGITAEATLPVAIKPKAVPTGGSVALDGRCFDPAYAADGGRLVLRYEGGRLAEVAMARVKDYVYVCMSGLPLHQQQEAVELRVDPDASADDLMQPTDRYFRLDRKGLIDSGVGDGGGGDVPDTDTRDVLGVVTAGGTSWQAELRVHESLLGDFVRLGVGHLFNGDEVVSWPETLDEHSPQTWGLVSMPAPIFSDGFESGDTSAWSF